MTDNDPNRANEVEDPADAKRTVVGGEGVDTGNTENYTVDKNESSGTPSGGAADDSDTEGQTVEPGTPVDEVHPNLADPS